MTRKSAEESERGISMEQILGMFMESQHWSPDVMLAYQRSQLEQLLRHAKTNVPFYQHRLDCLFRSDDTIDWGKWNDVPVLTRQDVQKHRNDLLARDLPPGHGPCKDFSTSGSTARPITMRVPSIMSSVGLAAWTRFYAAQGIPETARFAFIRTTTADGKPLQAEMVADQFTESSPGGQRIYVSRHLPEPRKLQLLAAAKPDVMTDFPNAIEILAHENLKQGKPFSVGRIITYGLGVSEHQARLFAESFGARTISTYCSKEAGPIALQCPRCSNHHVSEELVYVDRNFEAKKNLVLTPLFQSAQPFIRYQQDDIVTMHQGCTCGHQQLVITSIDGRTQPIFILPGDIRISPHGAQLALCKLHQKATGIQVAQVAPTKFEVRYMIDEPVSADDLHDFATELQDMLMQPVTIEFRKVTEIPANAGGKQQRFVREFDDGQSTAT